MFFASRLFTLALVAVLAFQAGCSTEDDPSTLVNDADKLLIDGGIEIAKNRAEAEQKYDRAIRLICGEVDLDCRRSGSGASQGTPSYNLAHAHFGLAFARTFDLVERIRQLYDSGTILRPESTAKVGKDKEKEQADILKQCEQQLNLPQLVPLLRTIVDTSLLPIVNDLKEVTLYPEFSIIYNKAFLDFAFLDRDLTDEYGIEFGTVKGDPTKFTVTEVSAILGVFRLVTLAAESVFSYNDLTQGLIVFLPKLRLGADVHPYELAKILNSDPCRENPLYDPTFGVLTESGTDTYKDIRVQLRAFFSEQQKGFALVQENEDPNALLNFESVGKPWGGNLVSRVHTGESKNDSLFQRVIAIITGIISPKEFASLFGQMQSSLVTGKQFDLAKYVDSNADLKDLLDTAGVDLVRLGVPALSFKRFFQTPISDLKSIAPLSYAESEPTTYAFNDAFNEVLDHEKPLDETDKNIWWNDVNGDLHWNRQGDFIVQPEREVFFDKANDNRPGQHGDDQRAALGILGTFWDGDFNGVPDVLMDTSGGVTTATQIPGTEALGYITAATDGVLWFITAVTSETTTYRDFFDPANDGSNGCLDVRVNSEDTLEECTLEVGQVLGHIWPSIFPEAFAPPAANDSRRKDPANGSVDRTYMFYPNPSFNGTLQIRGADGEYRAFGNEDLNRFVSGVLSLQDVVSDLASAK